MTEADKDELIASLRQVVEQARAEGRDQAATWIESVPQSLPNRQEYARQIRALQPISEVSTHEAKGDNP